MDATQHDVARAAGLSQTTISRVMRGDPAVSVETRDRVLRACEELAYRPSVGARMLAAGRAAVVGLSLPPLGLPTDRYVSVLHQSLARALMQSGWAAALLGADELAAGLPRIGAAVLIGVVEDDARVGTCRAAGVPVVAIGYPSDPAVASVAPDDAGGARAAMRHLLEAGRRRVAILSSDRPGVGPAMRIRRDAALSEARRAGLEPRVIEAERDATFTLAGYRTVMRAEPGFDALLCDTDEHALGALAALRDGGRRVPGDVRVVGFDDLPGLAAGLTTVRQDFDALARSAVALAVAPRAEGRVRVPVELVIRDT